jgi:energy-coupling factor transporter ATP-binding protein EcfA2
MADIHISDFDLEDIDARRTCGSSPTVLIIGGRGRGKSTVAKAVMRALQNIPSGVVFSGTEGSNSFYSDMVPTLFTFDTFDRAVLHKLIEQQKRSETPRDVFVLLDDMMYDSSFLRQPLMRSIFLNGRHYRITLLVTTQYAIDVPPALRSNVDYVFLMRESNVQTQQKLFKNFGGAFPHHTVFAEALKACTADFGAMVIDNVKERVCKYRVDLAADTSFRMFAPSVWKYATGHTRRKEHRQLCSDQCRIIIENA